MLSVKARSSLQPCGTRLPICCQGCFLALLVVALLRRGTTTRSATEQPWQQVGQQMGRRVSQVMLDPLHGKYTNRHVPCNSVHLQLDVIGLVQRTTKQLGPACAGEGLLSKWSVLGMFIQKAYCTQDALCYRRSVSSERSDLSVCLIVHLTLCSNPSLTPRLTHCIHSMCCMIWAEQA